MMPFGLGLRDLVGLVREAPVAARPIVVNGPRSSELAAELAHDGDRSLVRVGGDAADASAFVLVLDGPLADADEAQLRRATRASVPVLVLLLGGVEESYPYVLPEDVVVADPDGTLPIHEVGERLAATLGPQGIALAARLPVLRDAVSRRRTFEAVVGVTALTALSRETRPLLPILALTQARALRRLSLAQGEPGPTAPAAVATTVAPELVASLAVGVVCRTLVRHLPMRGRLVEGLVAGAGTLALTSAARRLRVTG